MQYVEKIRATVESLLFITNEPLNVTQICELAELEEDDVLDVLDVPDALDVVLDVQPHVTIVVRVNVMVALLVLLAARELVRKRVLDLVIQNVR